MIKIKNCPKCGEKKSFILDFMKAFNDKDWCFDCEWIRQEAIDRLDEIEEEKYEKEHEKKIQEMIKYMENERKKSNRSRTRREQ